MTALTEYDRLEASGLWRQTADDQRREVIVSIGEATLTISDLRDRALTHWSLAALERINPGERPAIYSPDGDPGETLEISENETQMIDAIEKLRRAIERSRPHPGRLRLIGFAAAIAAVLSLIVFWLPGALMRHAVGVVPEIKRQEIGRALLGRIERVAGQACHSSDSDQVIANLARRTGVRQVIVLRAGVADIRHLPGSIFLLNKALIEDHEDPAVVAGFIVTEQVRAALSDPLAELLAYGGPTASFRLLTTGEVTQKTLDRYAEHVLVAPRRKLPDDAALLAFAATEIPSTPYAYASDITGESVLGLIEADPMSGRNIKPVLADREWVLLQSICGG